VGHVDISSVHSGFKLDLRFPKNSWRESRKLFSLSLYIYIYIFLSFFVKIETIAMSNPIKRDCMKSFRSCLLHAYTMYICARTYIQQAVRSTMSQILPASLFCHLEFICQHILTHSKGIKTIRVRDRGQLYPEKLIVPTKFL
jgi:hypothetical protein